MKNKFSCLNLFLLLFFSQNIFVGQNQAPNNIINKRVISKTDKKSAEEKKLAGTYEMGNPLLWSAALVLYPDYHFNYSYSDDVSHINLHGKWIYVDSFLVLNSDDQLKDFAQIDESIDKKIKVGEKKFQVLDEKGIPAAAEFNINYQGKQLSTDNLGIAHGNIAAMDSFNISNCEKNIYPGVYVLKNKIANKVRIKLIKPYNSLFNKILTDEHWLYENQKIYSYSEKGEINRTVFFQKKAAAEKDAADKSSSPK